MDFEIWYEEKEFRTGWEGSVKTPNEDFEVFFLCVSLKVPLAGLASADRLECLIQAWLVREEGP